MRLKCDSHHLANVTLTVTEFFLCGSVTNEPTLGQEVTTLCRARKDAVLASSCESCNKWPPRHQRGRGLNTRGVLLTLLEPAADSRLTSGEVFDTADPRERLQPGQRRGAGGLGPAAAVGTGQAVSSARNRRRPVQTLDPFGAPYGSF